jgi:hypothetical protein
LKLETYFKSESTTEDIELEDFKKEFADPLFKEANKALDRSLVLPLGNEMTQAILESSIKIF